MDYVAWVGRISPESGAMAAILEKQGAVFYVLTNMSQVRSISLSNLIPGFVLFRQLEQLVRPYSEPTEH